MSQKEYIGPGRIDSLPGILRGLHASKILVITCDHLREKVLNLKEFSALAAETTMTWQTVAAPCARIKDIEEGLALCGSVKPDAILAIGHGYTLDAARVINLCFSAGISAAGFIQGDVSVPDNVSCRPLIAVPASPVSGGGATRVADIFIDRDAHVVSHELLRPAVSIVDARLMMGLAPEKIGAAGIHALALAVESYWSINATDESRNLAAEAIRMITPHVAEREESAVAAMAQGAVISGKAADLTGRNACHALAFPLTSVTGIDHDQSVGMILPFLYLYNSDFSMKDTLDPRGEEAARGTMMELNRLFGAGTSRKAVAVLRSLMKHAGMKPTLCTAGIAIDDLSIVIRSINFELIKHNPRPLNDAALLKLFWSVEGFSLGKRIRKSLYPVYLKAREALLSLRSLGVTLTMLGDKIRKRKIVVLELGEVTLIQYLHPIAVALAKRTSSVSIYIATKDIFLNSAEFSIFGGIERKWFPIQLARKLFLTDLYLAAYLHSVGPRRAIRLHVFHNLPVKHESFRYQDFINFNCHFILGDLTLKMLETTFRKINVDSKDVRIFKVGYPKSDPLLRGDYRREEVLAGLGLDPALPTVLYSPSWDEGMSLRSFGERIVELVVGMKVNLIVKLHPVSYSTPEHPLYYSFTGGVNWRERFRRFEDLGNFSHVISIQNINPLLAASDIMITDLSSVALEFILLDRPVIYIECPYFFERILPKNYIGWGNIDSDYIKSNPLTNAGRHVGLVVENIEELPRYISRCIENPGELSARRMELAATLLYNRGHASEVAADTIHDLLFSPRGSKIFNEL